MTHLDTAALRPDPPDRASPTVLVPSGTDDWPINTAEPGFAPGSFLIRDLPDTDYHQCREHISASGLKALIRSPSHFAAWKAKPQSPSTASQRIGKALHASTLEPERFEQCYLVFDGPRRGAAWQHFQRAHCTAEILTQEEMHDVLAMRDAIQSFGAVDLLSLLANARREQSIFWRDPDTQQGFRIRCDALHTDVIIDLKTTTDARPGPFGKQARNNQYDVQAAHYVDGVEMFTGNRLPFWLVAVEINPPYAVWVHEVGPQALHRAGMDIRAALKTLAHAHEPDGPLGYVHPWSTLDW